MLWVVPQSGLVCFLDGTQAERFWQEAALVTVSRVTRSRGPSGLLHALRTPSSDENSCTFFLAPSANRPVRAIPGGGVGRPRPWWPPVHTFPGWGSAQEPQVPPCPRRASTGQRRFFLICQAAGKGTSLLNLRGARAPESVFLRFQAAGAAA